jgi:hypothetical protein
MKFSGGAATSASLPTAASPDNVQPAKPPTLTGGHDSPQGTAPADGVGLVSAALNACNNGCCDKAWLQSSGPCGAAVGHNDINWFYFNAGSSWQNGSCGNFSCQREIYDAVCAGSGTTAFTFSYCANGCVTYHNNVAAAHYVGYLRDLEGDFWIGTSFSVTANSSSSPHLHTQCGYWYNFGG